MTRLLRSVTGCNCRHRKEPLAVSIVLRIEHEKPEILFNGDAGHDVERMIRWFDARPELGRLLYRANDLAERETTA
jgi:hypothetical protein